MSFEQFWPTLLSWGPPATVLGWMLWLIYTGKLHTKGEVDRMRTQYDDVIVELRKDRDDWKQIALQAGDGLEALTRSVKDPDAPIETPRRVRKA